MPRAEGTIEEVDGEVRRQPPAISLRGLSIRYILKPRLFPHVQVNIAQIWPD